MISVALDALGGDHAPQAVLEGAARAAARGDVHVILVGPRADLEAALARIAPGAPHLSVVDAPEAVAMEEVPLAALRRKPRASVKVAAALVASGDADALYSAGHTGATLLAAHSAFGLLPGVQRAAVAVTVPTTTGSAILLDAGANLECRPEHLEQFALMGSAYAEVALGRGRARVGLLSVGEEAGKGTEFIRESHARLVAAPIDFVGNLDAREIFTGRADVIVCDGFTGNVALKVGEGLVELIGTLVADDAAFLRARKRIDYAEFGGAPLLGVDRVVLVGHGRSSPDAIANGVAQAARLVREKVIEKVAAKLGV